MTCLINNEFWQPSEIIFFILHALACYEIQSFIKFNKNLVLSEVIPVTKPEDNIKIYQNEKKKRVLCGLALSRSV